MFFCKFTDQLIAKKQEEFIVKLKELKIYETELKKKISELNKLHLELRAKNYTRATESLKAQGGLEYKVKNNQFISPLEGKLSSKYGVRISPFHNDLRFHKGVDISAPDGTVVRSSSTGVVKKISYNSTYGKYIEIVTGKYLLRYAHLSEIFLEQGEKIKQASSLGLVGSTGMSTGPHLHLEVYRNNKAVDPKKIIQELN